MKNFVRALYFFGALAVVFIGIRVGVRAEQEYVQLLGWGLAITGVLVHLLTCALGCESCFGGKEKKEKESLQD